VEFHSPREVSTISAGCRDVDYLHKCIEDAGLYLIARPGPYFVRRLTRAGFRGGLLREGCYVALRDLSGPAKNVDRQYMGYVREWFEQITPRILK